MCTWNSTPDQIKAALISGAMTIFAAFVAACAVSLQIQESRNAELLKARKDAYELAFKVLNYSLASVPLTTETGKCLPVNNTKWDAMMAREAMDKLILYASNPSKSVNLFKYALGVKGVEGVRNDKVLALIEFRELAAIDLGTPALERTIDNMNSAWLIELEGSTSDVRCIKLKQLS